MTALRPEGSYGGYGAPYGDPHGGYADAPDADAPPGDPYGGPYGGFRGPGGPRPGPQAFEEAVKRLADPLNDPLPGQERAPHGQPPPASPPGPAAPVPPYGQQPYGPAAYAQPPDRAVPQEQPWWPEPAYDPYPGGYRGPAAPPPQSLYAPRPFAPAPVPAPEPAPEAFRPPAEPAGPDDGAAAPRTRTEGPAVPEPFGPPEGPDGAGPSAESGGAAVSGTAAEVPGGRTGAEPLRPPGEGRAARRRAQRERARRAAQDGPMVVASRVVGELFITLGVVMLLFVSHQLWWTNVIAGRQAGSEAESLAQRWQDGGTDRDPGVFSPGQGFAILYIPELDVKVPIAEGIDEESVLDRGMVGHYAEEPLKTAMPWDDTGNFALAGHRNTHGEPFRYINKLEPGDPIVVETRTAYFVYEMANRLDSTLPSNVSVIDPVPPESGFTEPGRYITLTTCTPEFTSKYRLIVWGRMVEERPRSEGKPDALVQ